MRSRSLLALVVAIAIAGLQTSILSAESGIGTPTPVLDPSGVRLSVTVNAVRTSPRDLVDTPPPSGRWVILDVTVVNVGSLPFDLSAGDFLIMSAATRTYAADGASDLPMDQLAITNLAPGQGMRGNILFALPGGVPIQAVLFQAPGTAQWVVALVG